MVDPILITGCARSGTSLTAGIISRLGFCGGKVIGATPHNQKGQYENVEIRNNMIKNYLRLLSVDPLGQNPLPNIDIVKRDATKEKCDSWKKRIFSILNNQGYDGTSPWYYKGAKICLIWPIWNKAFPDAKWVIVRRDDYDICSSCLKTSFMRAFNKRNGWQFWVNEHKKRFEEIKKATRNVFEFWPFKVIDGNFNHVSELAEFLSVDSYDEEEIKDFISPDLWHYKEEGGV